MNNFFKFHFDSSSSDSEEERRVARANEDRRIDEMIHHVATTIIPQIIDDLIQEERSTTRDQPRRDIDHESGHVKLFNDYFAENPVYDENLFRRRFRMRKHVFLRIVERVTTRDRWFRQRRDDAGRLGLSPLQKCTAAIRMLSYGMAPDSVDECMDMSERSARACLQHFTRAVISEFGNQYLRRPTHEDLERILAYGEDCGFPGMIGSLDCVHWEWKNCPMAWKGPFQGRDGETTLVLEAVADRDLWIWHSFLGMAGSSNDLIVLQRSPCFDDILEGRTPSVNFTVNGHQYNKGYYLTDMIYPKWDAFVKTMILPQIPKDKLFVQRHEAVIKDVERAFRVLQARFAIVRQPSLAWDRNILHNIMTCCIILHNMIVEDEKDLYAYNDDISDFVNDRPQHHPRQVGVVLTDERFHYNTGRIVDINNYFDINIYLQHRPDVREQQMHLARRDDLVEHIWSKFGAT